MRKEAQIWELVAPAAECGRQWLIGKNSGTENPLVLLVTPWRDFFNCESFTIPRLVHVLALVGNVKILYLVYHEELQSGVLSILPNSENGTLTQKKNMASPDPTPLLYWPFHNRLLTYDCYAEPHFSFALRYIGRRCKRTSILCDVEADFDWCLRHFEHRYGICIYRYGARIYSAREGLSPM